MKLAVLDFDSTVMDGETIDFLAGEVGQTKKVSRITEAAMRGELDFFDALQERVALLEGLEVVRVDAICQNLPLVKGASELINAMKEKSYRVIILSGGFRNATKHVQKILGYDAEFSNTLHSKNGRLTGRVGGEMMFSSSKGEMIERLQAVMNISSENTIVVGDGANDLSMFPYADKRVAFCAKPLLREKANIVIENRDLSEIIPHL